MIDPTDAQLKKLKKEDGAENFYTMADDNQFYMGSAMGWLDSVHCRMVNKKAKGSATFQTRSGRVIKVKTGSGSWAAGWRTCSIIIGIIGYYGIISYSLLTGNLGINSHSMAQRAVAGQQSADRQ